MPPNNEPRNQPDKADECFETRFERLKEIVEQLSEGELSLDQLEAHFKEGMKLCELCSKDLDRVEKSVETLVNRSENDFRTEPFDSEEPS